MEPISLIALSKQAKTLINKISSAAGIVYEPVHIVRMARAKAKADEIEVIAKIKRTELENRAAERFLQQESRKQQNIEQIIAPVVAKLPSNAKVENLDEDWLAYYFKQCDTVSDKEMQSLWSSILLGEATSPGTFSKRTVNLVSSIDKKDAELFTVFCQFVWVIDGELMPLIYKASDEIYTKQRITFERLLHLAAIGLISFEETRGYEQANFEKNSCVLYYDQRIVMEFFGDGENKLRLGHAVLTSVGKELFSICGSSSNNEFYEYVVHEWFQQGLVLSSVVA